MRATEVLVALATVLGGIASAVITSFTQRSNVAAEYEARDRYDEKAATRVAAKETRARASQLKAQYLSNGRVVLFELRNLQDASRVYNTGGDEHHYGHRVEKCRGVLESHVVGWPPHLKLQARSLHDLIAGVNTVPGDEREGVYDQVSADLDSLDEAMTREYREDI